MRHYPHLRAMRNRVNQKDREIAAPHLRSTQRWMSRMAEAENKLAKIEQLMTVSVARHFFECLGQEIARGAHMAIMKAIWTAEHDGDGMVHISISREALYVADTKSAERMLIEHARHLMADNLSVHFATDDRMVSVDASVRAIQLPDLRLRRTIPCDGQ